MFGISVFPGMEVSIDENLDYIRRSRKMGAEYIFTSLHIPEADQGVVEEEFQRILEAGELKGMKVIVDISKGYYERFQWERYSGIILRLDFGFGLEEIARLTHRHDIQLNGSTLDARSIDELKRYGARLDNISICHNYYPKPDTGISLEILRKRNQVFKGEGMKTMAFVCGSRIRRGPISEGLPTVEAHRKLHILTAAQELHMELCDVVIIGDSMGEERELRALKRLYDLKREGVQVVFPAEISTGDEMVGTLMKRHHHERMDSAEYVVRSQQSREWIGEVSIPPENTGFRGRGSITIDNDLYGRYRGELQICRVDLPADGRVNVVGRIGCSLLDRLEPGFIFTFVDLKEL